MQFILQLRKPRVSDTPCPLYEETCCLGNPWLAKILIIGRRSGIFVVVWKVHMGNWDVIFLVSIEYILMHNNCKTSWIKYHKIAECQINTICKIILLVYFFIHYFYKILTRDYDCGIVLPSLVGWLQYRSDPT